MLALSPTLFATTYGWPSEDIIAHNHQQDRNDISEDVEANSYNYLLDFPTYNQIPHDFSPGSSNSSGGAVNGIIGDSMKVVKKLNHNASERDRRKRVNDLYAFLRSLLPISADQKKKVSIPGTVSGALKYIPQLRKEVETLICKKENLSSYSLATTTIRETNKDIKRQSASDVIANTISSVVSSVSVLSDKEAVIQLISSNTSKKKETSKDIKRQSARDVIANTISSVVSSVSVLSDKEAVIQLISSNTSKKKETGSLSRVLAYLESEENGFVLLNSTTHKCSGEEMLLNTLHLQVQGDIKIEAEGLKEKLCNFHQQSDEL